MAAFSDTAFFTDAFSVNAFDFGSTPIVIEEDTHDGGKRRDAENKRFRKKKAKLREDLALAFNKTLGIEPPEEIEPAQMVQAIEAGISDLTIAGIEQRVIEKLLADYRQYEREKEAYDKRVREEEWDTDAMLAISYLVH